MIPPQLIPGDINAELLLDYFPEGVCKVALKGLHKRNTYKDVVALDTLAGEKLLLTVGRNSIYNSLPEYMFHTNYHACRIWRYTDVFVLQTGKSHSQIPHQNRC